MSLLLRLSVLLLLLLLNLNAPALARAQGSGIIEGQVSLAGEESLPPDLEVELLFLPNGQGPPVITSQPLEEDGSYHFTEVDTAPQHRYLVRVTYEGQEQFSDLLDFAAGEETLQVDIRLFPTTSDASALSVPQVSYLLDAQPGGWLVAALYRFRNEGEQRIFNESTPPITVPLPSGAANLQFSQEIPFAGIVETLDGFAFSGPFEPGESQLIFSFSIPYQEGEQVVTIPLGAPIGQLRLLVPELGQVTEVEGLSLIGSENALDGQPYEIYEATGINAAEAVTLKFSGLPPAPTPAPADLDGSLSALPDTPRVVPVSPLERMPWWGPLVPVALLTLGVVLYIGARSAPSLAEQRAALRQRRDALINEIAALDTRFEEGTIGEQTHLRQRTVLKNELRDILRQLGSGAVGGD